MSNLVQRLRDAPTPPNDPNLPDEAAAAVERLQAELEAAQADTRRLDSGCIAFRDRDDYFGDEFVRVFKGVDLRACIDDAIGREATTC